MGATKGSVPKLDPFSLVDLAQGLARFKKLSQRVDLDAPWLSPGASRLDRRTFGTWIDRNLRTPKGRAYFQVACEAVFSADPADVSLLHALFYAKSNVDLEALMAVDQGAQLDRVDGGSVRVSEELATRLTSAGGTLLPGSPVRTIRQTDDGVSLETVAGEVLTGDRVIVTLPPTLAGRLQYEPIMPSWRDQLTQRVPAGSVIKAYLVYSEPFWRRDGLNGQAGTDVGPVKVTFDNSPPGYEKGIMMGFFEGADGRVWARRSPEERRRAFIDCLVPLFGEAARAPLEYIERDWMDQEFTRGCYGAHFAPGVWTAFGPALTEPVGRIHWAGAETAPVWSGYMEGAVRSGERVATEVLTTLQ